jgi:DNA-binding FrmR family transcriptional regulator
VSIRASEGRAIARANGKLAAIRELLDRDHVCLDIVRYLLGNGEAADTARGIAEWWINREVSRTSEALTRLQALGVVRSYLVQDATSVYGLTKNPLLRDTLRQCVNRLSQSTSTEIH